MVAVTRLCSGVRDICAHPPSAAVMNSGANVVVIERGAIPRDTKPANKEWNAFDAKAATQEFDAAGYHVVQKREPKAIY